MEETKLTLEQLSKVTERMPFNQLLGIQIAEVHDDGITVRCALRPHLMNGGGVMHGGVTASVADAVVGLAVFRHFGGLRKAVTTELKINYLRPIASGELTARCRLVRIGKHLCVGQVDLLDAEKNLAAIATASYLMLDS